MSGNGKIVWDQLHDIGEIKEEEEEGEREVKEWEQRAGEGCVVDSLTVSSACQKYGRKHE